MNTVKIKIKHGSIGKAVKDIRRWRIKHLPFRKTYGGLEVEMYPNPKITLLILKYAVDIEVKDAIM